MVYPRATDKVLVFESRPLIGTLPTWTAPVVVNAAAKSDDQVSLALGTSATVVMLVWRDLDGKGYYSTQTTAGTGAWTVPAPLVSGTNPLLASAPSVARGVCGDDFVVTFVTTTGDVKLTRLRSSAFTTPETVATLAAGTGHAAVATAR